jgi:hypothetical protein
LLARRQEKLDEVAVAFGAVSGEMKDSDWHLTLDTRDTRKI